MPLSMSTGSSHSAIVQCKIHVNNANMQHNCICGEELGSLGMSSEVVKVRYSHTHIKSTTLYYRTQATMIGRA